MAETSGARGVMPHPPGGVPRYFDGSPFDDARIAGVDQERSRRLALYDELAKDHFARMPREVGTEELAWLEGYQRERLEAEREERRMHFGAFALVSVLFFILLPTFVSSQFVLALGLLELLLLALIVPYVFIYFGYENRVRAMTLGLLRLIEARAVREEQRAGDGTGAVAGGPSSGAEARERPGA
jgi:hypothetical protein